MSEHENISLTLDELQALVKVVNSVQTSVQSAPSWLAVKAKLERMIQILDEADKNKVDTK
jgi:hypothetical protein